MTTPEATKPCFRCKAVKPIEDFIKDPRLKSGRHANCRACQANLRSNASEELRERRRSKVRERYKRRAAFHAEESATSLTIPEATQPCTMCKAVKPLDAFNKEPRMNSGRRSNCKECQSLYKRNMSEELRDRRRAKERETYWADRAAALAKNHRSYANNKAARKAGNKKWVAAHAEETAAYLQQWRRANKLAVSVYTAAYRARKLSAEGRHTEQDLIEIRASQKDRCAACRIRLNGAGQADHIIALSKGGSNHRSNMQWLCVVCNRTKRDRDPVEFMQSMGHLI